MSHWRSSEKSHSFSLSSSLSCLFVLLILTSFFSLSHVPLITPTPVSCLFPVSHPSALAATVSPPLLYHFSCSFAYSLCSNQPHSSHNPLLTGRISASHLLIFSLCICASQHLAWPIDLPLAMDQSVYWCISFLQTLIHSRWRLCLKNSSSSEHLVTCNFC